MFSTRLLAKSIPDNTRVTLSESALLSGHLEDVFESAGALLGSIGTSMLSAVGLDSQFWLNPFKECLLLAAAVHDIGKANNHFQKAVHGNAAKGERQPVRHEWISIWIATQPEIKNWLLPAVAGCEKNWLVSMCAIAGHHPKIDNGIPESDNMGSEEIEVFSNHADFKTCLKQFQIWFELDSPPSVSSVIHSGAGDLSGKMRFNNLLFDIQKQASKLTRNQDWKKFCAVVKASLINADVAGSALWEKIDSPSDRIDWIKSSLTRVPSKQDLTAIVEARLGNNKLHDFQEKIANSTAEVTLVEAGCGSGKTIAAYAWAARQHANRRLWFCYPTTGTATEGFKGYLFGKLDGVDQARSDLFHSRKEYDLKLMLENNTEHKFDPLDTTVRVQSLHAWDTQIINCTVDNVLFLLQNQRRGLYAWPALANSVIVFDEVHCFDDVLFANLLQWLEALVGIPVLLMTASLPCAKRKAIESACEFSNRTLCHIPQGPPKLEGLPRYQQSIASVDDCVERVANELRNNGRVLWISNTVDRTRAVGDIVCQEIHDDPVYYHSRFIYEDRVKRHNEVVRLFDNIDSVGLASTSQVAEMSLDLGYATLLITELAPIPALIQRLGRLNRRANPDVVPPIICDFVVIEPTKDGEFCPLPYNEHELELAREWLKQLGKHPVSQTDLAEHWHALDNSEERILSRNSGWLEGGFTTPIDSIREGSYGITVICKRHEQAARRDGTSQYVLPMNRPIRDNWQASEYRLGGFPIASDEAIDYEDKKGAKWASHNTF